MVDTLGAQSGVAEVSEYAEIGKVVAYIQVSDPDSGRNGQTSCSIDNPSFTLLKIKDNIYNAKLTARLDRETQDSYTVLVECPDMGFPKLTAVQSFQVRVLDENDERPVFTPRDYHTQIYENNPPGKLVQHLSAVDGDIGVNAELVYQVKGMNQKYFGIHDNGTLYAKVSLDRELSDRLVIPVTVTDKGSPALSSAGSVTLTLLDVNDVAPHFEQTGYKFSVDEEEPRNKYVGLVKALDEDLGSNKDVFYHLEEDYELNDGSFSVEMTSGVIKTNRVLDREVKETHSFVVLATDRGTPALTGTVSVVVTVTDINDNQPYFLYPIPSNNSLSLPHSFEENVDIVSIRAVDKDTGPNAELVYSISSINESSPFRVGSKTGSLFLTRSLTADDCGTYMLTLSATDRGQTKEHAQLAPLTVDVFFDNSTLYLASNEAGTSSTIIAVGAVLGAILVLCVVVLGTWCLYKKQQAKRNKGVPNSASSSSTQKLHGSYYVAPGVRGSTSSFLSKPDDGSTNRAHDDGMKTTNPSVVMVPAPVSDNPPEESSSFNIFPFLDDKIVEIACNGHHPLNDPNNTTELSDPTEEGGPFSTFRSQEDILNSGYRSGSLNRRNLDNSTAKLPLDEDETSLDSTS